LVQDLARTASGGLIAWVHGSHRYATTIESKGRTLIAACTCPYGGVCKHAVAVVLEYLEQVKRNRTIPPVTGEDRRLQLLKHDADEEEDGDITDEDSEPAPLRPSRKAGKAAVAAWQSFLEQQSQPQLLSLLKDLAQRDPEVRQFLQDRQHLSAGKVPKLVQSLRAEIAALSAEPGWRHHWSGEGSIPDYSRVRDRLEALLAQGHADTVMEVGTELLEAGTRQVEMSNDEGETAEEIASCVDIVFQALPKSSRAPAEQMWWAVEADLADEYELCRGAKAFWERKHRREAWNALADQLTQRLAQDRSGKTHDNFSDNFRRDRLSNWLILALERAGRREEIIPLCRQEAEMTGSYLRLVEQLKNAKRWEEAEQWIRKGIAASEKRWPGIAGQLRTAFREMRERQQDWRSVAALRADEFFREPSLPTFQALQKAPQRAGVGPTVRAAAMHYLETGTCPQPSTPSCPLPESRLHKTSERPWTQAPMIDTLIDIAIAEKRPDDVLRWYDQGTPRSRGWEYSGFADDRVAEAVEGTYPDRAVAIWKQLAEQQIALTKPKAYEEAARYLRKVHRVLKQLGKEPDWQGYLVALRRANERKRRLVQVLDILAGRRIIEEILMVPFFSPLSGDADEPDSAMRYDPETAPDPEKWLALDESQRLDLVAAYHRRTRVKLPNARLHAALHGIVENQLAEGFDFVREALERLRGEGLDRHEAIHAIGLVLTKHMWSLLREGAKTPDPNEPYFQALRALTANSWREEFGATRTRIPSGTKLPVTLTLRERDLIRDETFCDHDFAKCAVVDGTGISVDLSLDEIEEIQGYVAATANHTRHAKLRKELDRLFDKLQAFLDTYDDQGE
jgi:uncharacterized Zn finger protein